MRDPVISRKRLGLVLLGAVMAAQLLAEAGEWESHGPAFSEVTALAVSPADDRVIYAGATDPASRRSALFQSSDGGETWTALSEALPGESIRAIAIDPSNPAAILAVASRPGTSHVYRSKDGGQTWFLTILLPGAISSVFFGTGGGGIGYLIGDAGLWGSTSDLAWDYVKPTLLPPLIVLGIAQPTAAWPAAGGRLFSVAYITTYPYILSGFRLLRRDSFGWTEVALPCQARVRTTAFDVSNPDRMFVSAPDCPGLLETNDGAKTWEQVTTLGNVEVRAIIVSDADPATLYVLVDPDSRILHSLDGGASWSAVAPPPSPPSAIALGPEGKILYAATSQGVFAQTIRQTRVLAPRE